MIWYNVNDCLPPKEDIDKNELVDMKRSKDVLILNHEYIMIGYLQYSLLDDKETPRWYLQGRDMYFASKVTHWAWLPDKP